MPACLRGHASGALPVGPRLTDEVDVARARLATVTFVLAILVSLQSTVSDHQRGITDTRASMVGKLAWLEEQRALLQKEVDVFGKEVEKFKNFRRCALRCVC